MTEENNVKFIAIDIAIHYGEERESEKWEGIIDIDAKKVLEGQALDMSTLKMSEGTYILYDEDMQEIARKQVYAPGNLLPTSIEGDLELKIDEEGNITNWLENPDFSDFGVLP